MFGLMEIVFANAVIAGGLAILAMVVTRAGRWPAIAHILWVLVLVKLVSPPVLNAPIEFSWPSSLSAAYEPAVSETLKATGQTTTENILNTGAFLPTPSQPSSTWSAIGNPTPLLFSVWALGSIYCLAILLIRTLRFRNAIERSNYAPKTVQQLAAELSAKLGLSRSPEVRLVSRNLTPLVWVTPQRQVVVLPERLLKRVDVSSLETLLAHELAHLRRRDHWIRLVETIATVLLWWHPLVWLARHQIRVTEEMCCDAWVVALLPKSSGTYARTLIETVSFLSDSRTSVPSLASGMGPVSSMRRRIIMIMHGSTSRTASIPSRLILALLALIVLPLAPSIAQDKSTALDNRSTAERSASSKQQEAKAAEKDECNCAMCCLGLACIADCFANCTLEDCKMECLSCTMQQGHDGKLQCVMRLKDGTTKTIPMCTIGDRRCFSLIAETGIFGKRSTLTKTPPSGVRTDKEDLRQQIRELQKQLTELRKQLQDR